MFSLDKKSSIIDLTSDNEYSDAHQRSRKAAAEAPVTTSSNPASHLPRSPFPAIRIATGFLEKIKISTTPEPAPADRTPKSPPFERAVPQSLECVNDNNDQDGDSGLGESLSGSESSRKGRAKRTRDGASGNHFAETAPKQLSGIAAPTKRKRVSVEPDLELLTHSANPGNQRCWESELSLHGISFSDKPKSSSKVGSNTPITPSTTQLSGSGNGAYSSERTIPMSQVRDQSSKSCDVAECTVTQGLSPSPVLTQILATKDLQSHSFDTFLDLNPSPTAEFPPGFDRGRFPAQRRRRGGMKYGTPRKGAYPKPAYSPKARSISNIAIDLDKITSLAESSSQSPVDAMPFQAHENLLNGFPRGRHAHYQHGDSSIAPESEPMQKVGLDVSKSPWFLEDERHKKQESVKGTDATPLNRHLPAPKTEDKARLADFYASFIYPVIKSARGPYKGQVSKKNLTSIEMSISVWIVNEEAIMFLQKINFKPDQVQRRQIESHIKNKYASEVAGACHKSLTNESIGPFPWSSITNGFQGTGNVLPTPRLSMFGSTRSVDRSAKELAVIKKHDLLDLRDQDFYDAGDCSEVVNNERTYFAKSEERHNFVARHSSTSARSMRQARPPRSKIHQTYNLKALSQKSVQGTDNPDAILLDPPYMSSVHHAKDRQRSDIYSDEELSKPALAYESRRRSSRLMKLPPQRSFARVNAFYNPELASLSAQLAIDNFVSCQARGGRQKTVIDKYDQEKILRGESVFLHVDRSVAKKPILTQLESRVADPTRRSERALASLLRHRELGSDPRGRNVNSHAMLRSRATERLRPWRSWKGASGDIVSVAWAPDSYNFAVGAAAHSNIEDLQYNRPCNLLIGRLDDNTIEEIPDHRVDRPRPETIPNGPNSTQAVYDACDPQLYKTVSSIAFSPFQSRMYTASHDHTVKVWDVSQKHPRCVKTLLHRANVTSVEISIIRKGIFATAAATIDDPVRIYHHDDENPDVIDTAPLVFSSSRAKAKPQRQIYPECLRWGPTPQTSHLLLAGFQQGGLEDIAGEGHLCLWDVDRAEPIKIFPCSQSVYTTTWHPSLPYFATGGSPGAANTHEKGTLTMVRTWDLRSPARTTMEYECPASDMQDITFQPIDSNIVTAGCTDGSSYVWDYRWPRSPLHRLQHGAPLNELNHRRSRAEADTGVMLSLWDFDGRLYYSGSSDGAVKAWDIRRHPQDVLTDNVIQLTAGVQSGAFSPDGSNLLVGDADGGCHILSSAPYSPQPDREDLEVEMTLVRAPTTRDKPDIMKESKGILLGRELLDTEQVSNHPIYGIGQGPNYKGPFAHYARKESTEGNLGRLHGHYHRKQAFTRKGEIQENNAAKVRAVVEGRKSLDRKAHITGFPHRVQLSQPSVTFASPNKRNGLGLIAARKLSNSAVEQASSLGTHIDPEEGEESFCSEGETVEEDHWWPGLGADEIRNACISSSKISHD